MGRKTNKHKIHKKFIKNNWEPPISGTSPIKTVYDESSKINFKHFYNAIKKINQEENIYKETIWTMTKNLYRIGKISKEGFISDAKDIGIDNFQIIKILGKTKKLKRLKTGTHKNRQ